VHHCPAVGLPQLGQKRQPSSSSAPQAAQFTTVRFCPQCGQKVMGLPPGSDSPHDRQDSPGLGTTLGGA